MSPFLLQMTGESGAGKSTLARAFGKRTGAVVLDKDLVQTSLMAEGLASQTAGGTAYGVLFSLVESLLEQGFSVVLDSAAFWSSIVERGVDLSQRLDVDYRIVECRCADVDQQELRLAMRPRLASQPGSRAELAASLARPGVMLAVEEPHLVVDTTQPLETCVERVIEYMQS